MNLQDSSARKIAEQNITQNIIVEAGAGTGKTTLLVKRMLYLLFIKHVKLSRIVALTFTKKAAASLKQKLEEHLYTAFQVLLNHSFVLTAKDIDFEEQLKNFRNEEQSKIKNLRLLFVQSGLDKDKLQDLLRSALEEIPLCQIGTIHSFCLFILKKYALEAGLNTEMKIDEGTVIDIIFDKYWASFLDEELSLTSPNKDIWLAVLKEVSLEDLKDFARNLCTPRFEDYDPRDNYPYFKIKAQNYLNDAEHLLKTHKQESNLTEALKKAAVTLKQYIDFYKGKQAAEDQEITYITRVPGKLTGWDKTELDLARTIFVFIKDNSLKPQKLLIKAYNLLKSFARKVQKEMLKQNYLTYDEIIFRTHHLIINNKEVRQELKLSYDHIFIDEFQDTDPIQGEIVLFLAETLDTFVTKWQDLKLSAGKVFIVGDPKQSIYHFRGADISAYQNFCNLLKNQGAEVCVLQNNFRSAKEIIDYVNAFGTKQIKFKANMQAEYQEIYPSKTFNKARVELYLYDLDDSIKKPDLRLMCAQSISKWICENVKQTKKSDGTILDYKDIAVLIPAATNLNVILNSFKENDIPYSVEEDRNFYSSQEVLDLINILKVLKNPQDKIALIGVLRSPVGLVNDEILLRLVKENELNIYADIKDKSVQKIYAKLKCLREKMSSLNPLQIINEILEIFDFSSYQVLASSTEQVLANILKFKQVAAKLFDDGAYTLEQLLDNLETYQKEEGKESSAILTEENFNVVKILTIHKAKGLEYPVVILTDLSKDFSRTGSNKSWKDKALYSRSLNAKGLMLGSIGDNIIPLIEKEKKEKEFEEKRRLLYVAMTRAKEALIIIDDFKTAANTYTSFLSEAGCWPSENEKEKGLLSAKIFYQKTVLPEIAFPSNNRNRNTDFIFDYQTWKENFDARQKEYKKYLENTCNFKNERAIIYPSKEVEYAIKVGSLCHRILQGIFLGKNINLETETDRKALNEANSIIGNFTKTAVFNELKNMECLAVEFPFTIIDNGIIKNGIIDALFKTKEGNIRIVDFKSDKINVVNAKTVEPKYIEQITFYKQALGKIFEGRIERCLVYLRPAVIYNVEE